MRKRSEIDELKIEHAWRYVCSIDDVVRQRNAAEDEIALIDSMACPGAVRYDSDTVFTSANDDAIPNAVAASIEDKENWIELRDACNEEISSFCLALRYDIRSIGGRYMYYHFRYGLPWSAIADAANVSVSTVANRRDDALLEMYDKDLVPLEYRIPGYRAI